MIRSTVIHEDGTREVRVIAERGQLVMDAESGEFSIEDNGHPAKARIWREGWDSGAPWASEVPGEWNPQLAYDVPGDPESSYIDVYGFTTWETFEDALTAVRKALAERVTR